MSNQGAARIPCPRCRANNFLGTPNCWSCGGSLPPPESFAPAPPQYAPQPQYSPQPQVVQVSGMRRDEQAAIQAALALATSGFQPRQQAVRRGGLLKWFILGLSLASIVVAMLAVGHLSKTKKDADSIDRTVKQLGDLQDQYRRALGDTTPTTSIDPGSPEGRGQQEIKRLERQLGPLSAPADASGKVHLQTGGSISAEEWERARRSITPGN